MELVCLKKARTCAGTFSSFDIAISRGPFMEHEIALIGLNHALRLGLTEQLDMQAVKQAVT